MSVKCYWLEELNKVRRYLRRFHYDCESTHRTIMNVLDEQEKAAHEYIEVKDGIDSSIPLNDARWPTRCACGHEFDLTDPYQVYVDRLYRRTDTGEILTLRDAPPGGMFDAWWLPFKGPDGKSLVVKLPPDGHDWHIDSRANNCDKPKDMIHRCWCRHGEVPNITVDKNGDTCSAGGGSILTTQWHGHLKNGELVEC